MKNNFSLQQISQTGNLDSNLILRQYELDLMARFMEIQSVNPKLGQNQIGKELGCSSKTLKRYKNDKNMLSPYRIPNSNKKRQKNSSDLKRPQMTSNGPLVNSVTKIVATVDPVKTKNKTN